MILTDRHGQQWTLLDKNTLEPINRGDTVTTFRGEKGTLEGGRVPHKPSSTGRVYVKGEGEPYTSEFFPSVIDAMWVKNVNLGE